MHTCLRGALTLALLVAISNLAWADRAPPPNGPPKQPAATDANADSKLTAPVVIYTSLTPSHDEKPIIAHIKIPRAMAKKLLDAPDAKQGSALHPDFRTLMAGLSLSAAAVCGLFVLRGRRNAKWIAAGCVLLAAVLGTWRMATANTPPPSLIKRLQAGDPFTEGRVVIEITDGTEDRVQIFTARRDTSLIPR